MTPRQRYLRRLRRLSIAGGAVVAESWRQIRGLDEENIAELAELATPRLQLVADRAAGTSAAYLAYATGSPIPAPTAPIVPDWRSPFTVAWKALGDGKPLDEALTSGESVADVVGTVAVISAGRRVGDQLTSSDIAGWRRVTTSGDACPWCVGLTSVTFVSAEAADFGHDRCHCGVLPITR